MILTQQKTQWNRDALVIERPEGNAFVASFAQERLWLLHQLNPDLPTYNINVAFRLKGKIRLEIVEQALSLLVERHESLRTVFTTIEGRPYQQIQPPWSVELEVVKLSKDDCSDDSLRNIINRFNEQSFDIDNGPLFRVAAFELNSDDYLIDFSMHHAISDGWSLAILTEEFSECYRALSNGTLPNLRSLTVQYADYAVWQREHTENSAEQAQLEYWKSHLHECPRLEIATDPNPLLSGIGGLSVGMLSLPAWDALKSLSAKHGATPFMGLLACMQVLLAKLSDQDDIVIGTPVASRHRRELERLIGCFLNSLALRSRVCFEENFVSQLQRAKETAVGAFANQSVPFERIIQAVGDGQRTSTPFFQVLLNLFNFQSADIELPDATVEVLEFDDHMPRFDLTFYAVPRSEGLQIKLVYDRSKFESARASTIVQQLLYVIQQVITDPSLKLERISLVDPHSATRLPNASLALSSRTLPSVARLFQQTVERYRNLTAIEQGKRRITYGALLELVGVFSSRITECSTSTNDVVAIAGDKSIELIASILAVQNTGRVLLLIDPSLPDDRQVMMLQEAGCKLHIRFEESSDEPKVSFAIHHYDIADAKRIPHTLDAAYIFFTSGSTGTPKPVVGNAQGLSHFLIWQQQEFKIGPGDRIAQLTAFSFDVVLRDIFLPLTSGATLVLPSNSDLVLSAEVLTWLELNQINTIHSVPSLMNFWLVHQQREPLTKLRWIFSAGEPLYDTLCHSLFVLAPNATIVNLYGPTETTLAKFYEVIGNQPRSGVQPVGTALPDTQALVIKNDNMCGVGEAGEIAIRTPYRSCGYLTDCRENRSSFTQNVLATTTKDDLIYRTGDIGRYLPDGRLEILGRRDDQIKIRGVRIEPAEIVSAIKQSGFVKQAYVRGHNQENGEKELVAYVLPTDNDSFKTSELHLALSRRLPNTLVPRHIIALEFIPLLPNGKVDWKKLPLPSNDSVAAFAADDYVPPTTSTEVLLCSTFQQVLRYEPIGATANFFGLGGHSLLAAQLVSRVEKDLNITLPLRTIFEYPTVRSLAQYIDSSDTTTLEALPPVEPITSGDRRLLSFAQEALWFLDRLSTSDHSYTTFPVLQVDGQVDLNAFQVAAQTVIDRHEILRTIFPEIDGQPTQQTIPEFTVSLDLNDLTDHYTPAVLEQWVTYKASMRINLQTGPILRIHLAKIAENRHVVLIAWHHIIHDGWSLRVLSQELLECYQAILQKRQPNLPHLHVQYADWAHWQRRLLGGKRLQSLQKFWQRQLADVPSIDLPTDFNRPAVRTTNGDYVRIQLTEELGAKIQNLALDESATPYMVLLAAYRMTLAQFSSQTDFAIGSPVANRRRPETETLIGYFINMLALRADLKQAPTGSEVIRQTREMVLDAFEHQDLTLDQVVATVNPERDVSRHPLFQVMFVLHNQEPLQTEIPGLSFKPLELTTPQSSYFELNLVLTEENANYSGALVYNCDLFRHETAERIVNAFVNALEQLTSQPRSALREIDLLTCDERQEILGFGNALAHIEATRGTWQDVFAEQVHRASLKTALIAKDREFSYVELNQLSDAFANRLFQQGVRSGDFVAIDLPRSASAIIAIIGILKCGAAYVPIDERAPNARKREILEDCGAKFIVLDNEGKLINTTACACTPIRVPSLEQLANCEPCDRQPVSPEDAAYVIYTSGSTGKPKGVVVSHRAVTSYAAAATHAYRINSHDRILQFASLSFDAHVEELSLALLNGGTLVIRSEESLHSIPQFLSFCEHNKLSTLSLPTGFWNELVFIATEENLKLPSSVRKIIIGGEAAQRESLEKWFRLAPHIELINSYGPTETTVVATATTLQKQDTDTERISIGKPLPNTTAFVLSEDMHLQPIGVRGELYLGGASVATEYLGLPELTTDRFVDSPFSTDAQPKLYRTGDIVCWRADGQLEFFGRRDHQIKIRGFRVELAEIEHACRQIPGVRDAVVLTNGENASNLWLSGYILTTGESQLSVADLREQLLHKLADYMIPTKFAILEQWPLNSSGKIDRKALRSIASKTVEQTQAPREMTDTKQRLLSIFREITGRNELSVDDDFFTLGGSSLTALRMVSQIQRVFGVEVSMVHVLGDPTVRGIATYIDSQLLTSDHSASQMQLSDVRTVATTAEQFKDSVAAIESTAVDTRKYLVRLNAIQQGTPIFCIHGLGGHVLNFIPLARELTLGRPVFGLQGRGIDGKESPHDDLTEMAEIYTQAIISNQPLGTVQLIGWSMGGLLAIEVARNLQTIGREVDQVILLDTHINLKNRSIEAVTDESIVQRIAPRLGIPLEQISKLGIEDQWDAILQRSQSLGAELDRESGNAEILRLATTCKAHLTAINNYRIKYIDAACCLLQASRPWQLVDPRWKRLCHTFDTAKVPGSHYSMMAKPDVNSLARKIEALISKTSQFGEGKS